MESNELEEIETKQDKIAKPKIVMKFIRNSFLKQFECTVCPCSYTHGAKLRYHVRREHYNLIANITKREKRKINDVWLERVINSNDFIEIKKTGHNKYLMKKASNADCLEVTEANDTIDLTPLYPDCNRPRGKRVWCCICKNKVFRKDYKKHMQEQHDDLVM